MRIVVLIVCGWLCEISRDRNTDKKPAWWTNGHWKLNRTRVSKREREREGHHGEWGWVGVKKNHLNVRVWLSVSSSLSVGECVCVSECERERERERVVTKSYFANILALASLPRGERGRRGWVGVQSPNVQSRRRCFRIKHLFSRDTPHHISHQAAAPLRERERERERESERERRGWGVGQTDGSFCLCFDAVGCCWFKPALIVSGLLCGPKIPRAYSFNLQSHYFTIVTLSAWLSKSQSPYKQPSHSNDWGKILPPEGKRNFLKWRNTRIWDHKLRACSR